MEFITTSKFKKKIPRKGSGLYYDPLYGYIPLPNYVREMMDLEVFQRLRGIKQLSTVYLTFPGAVHTRFDHCVGTAHLSSIMFKKLQELVDPSDSNAPKFNKTLETCMLLSSLLHDVGHGPFGHIFEMFCKRKAEFSEWTHEKLGKKLITGKDGNNDIEKKEFKQIRELLKKIKNNLKEMESNPENLALLNPINIYNIAAGKEPDLREPKLNNKYYFLKNIIASSYGIDRLDYLKRDSYFSGVNTGNVDIGEIISSLMLFKYEGKYRLFLKPEAAPALESILQARNLVYRRLYHNSVHRSAQELIIRGLIELDMKPEELCLLTDNEILNLFSEKNYVLKDISERIKFRILYENLHICSHIDIKNFKSELNKYSKKEKEWIKLKRLEDSIANDAGMDKNKVFYDIEIIPAVVYKDFSEEVFYDTIEEKPKSLFDLANHLEMIYGQDKYTYEKKADYFNESVSDIIVCFPYDEIVHQLEEIKSKYKIDLTKGVEELYKQKLDPLIKGLFEKILKVLESDNKYFQKKENKEKFENIKKRCINYLLDLVELL